jgi:hypothetical protein
MGSKALPWGLQLVKGPYLRTRLALAAACLVLWWILAPSSARGAPPPQYEHQQILEAIRLVESGGRWHPPDGDGGLAIGPLQIHRAYWQDSGVPGEYQDCRRLDYAERVLRAYMRRFVPKAWQSRDAEVIARTHNGGPEGRYKRATDVYWQRVKKRLASLAGG